MQIPAGPPPSRGPRGEPVLCSIQLLVASVLASGPHPSSPPVCVFSSLSVSISLCLSLVRVLDVGFRVHQDNARSLT